METEKQNNSSPQSKLKYFYCEEVNLKTCTIYISKDFPLRFQ